MLEEQAPLLPVRLAADDDERCQETFHGEVPAEFLGVPHPPVLHFQCIPAARLGIDFRQLQAADGLQFRRCSCVAPREVEVAQVRLATEGHVAGIHPAHGGDQCLRVLSPLETVGLKQQRDLPLVPVLVGSPQGVESAPHHDVRHARTGLLVRKYGWNRSPIM